jgi:hypothetical protein
VRPKCHPCRLLLKDQPAPIQCACCRNWFVCPSGVAPASALDAEGRFRCAACIAWSTDETAVGVPAKCFDVISTSLLQLLATQRQAKNSMVPLFRALGLEPASAALLDEKPPASLFAKGLRFLLEVFPLNGAGDGQGAEGEPAGAVPVSAVASKTCSPSSAGSSSAAAACASMVAASSSSASSASSVRPPVSLRCGGKAVLNAEEVVEQLRKFVDAGLADMGTCLLCFTEVTKGFLSSACGNCSTPVCNHCNETWWGESKPGDVLLPARLTCPYCKRKPTTKTLKRFNRQLGALLHKSVPAFDTAFYHVWCAGCYQVKQFLAKDCAEGLPPSPGTKWRCSDCEEDRRAKKAQAEKTARALGDFYDTTCPSCKMAIHRVDGCPQ